MFLSWLLLYLCSLFPFYLLFCPYLYITFAMLLCLVCVCLSVITHMAPTPHTHWDIRPHTRVYVSHKEWRSICDHCRNVPFAGERGRGSRVRFPKEERCTESPPTFICGKCRKNRRKPVKMKILSSGVVFTLEEGISTSYVCLGRQQPIF